MRENCVSSLPLLGMSILIIGNDGVLFFVVDGLKKTEEVISLKVMSRFVVDVETLERIFSSLN
jgi:hypothetical protein